MVVCLPVTRADYGNFVLLVGLTGFGHIVWRCRGGWIVLLVCCLVMLAKGMMNVYNMNYPQRLGHGYLLSREYECQIPKSEVMHRHVNLNF